MNNSILQLQLDYLNGSEDALTELYTQLVKLGKTIIRLETLSLDSNAAYDVATSVVMRLKEFKKIVISSSPSAFVKKALFYTAHNQQKNHNNQCVQYPTNFYTTDEYFQEQTVDDLVREILANIQIPEDLRQEVEYCLYSQQTVHAVRVHIRDREAKKRFTLIMEEIHEYINQKAVCVSMLSGDSNGRPQVLPKASVPRRKKAKPKVVTAEPICAQPLLFSSLESFEIKPAQALPTMHKVRGTSNRGTPPDTTPWLPGFVL